MDKTVKERMKRYRNRKRNESVTEEEESVTLRNGMTKITGGAKPIYVNTEKAARLLLICQSLDRTVSGLTRGVNLLSQVRYGVRGPTMQGVMESLTESKPLESR